MPVLLGVILCLVVQSHPAFSFVTTARPPSLQTKSLSKEIYLVSPSLEQFHGTNLQKHRHGSTQLQVTLFPSVVRTGLSTFSPSVRAALLVGAAFVAVINRKKIMYPGARADPKFSEPLAESSNGCPFFGGNFLEGTIEAGPGQFYRNRAKGLGNPPIFNTYLMGKPITIVSSMKMVKKVFNFEYKKMNSEISLGNFKKLMGWTDDTLLTTPDVEYHSYLRRLVGQSMTPDAIKNAMPALTETATVQIDNILEQPTIMMENALTNFTLDIAWRQILGLDLSHEEIPVFYEAVNNWIGGMVNPRVLFLPGVRFTKAGRARDYLISKIDEKVKGLEDNGPDGSTLSAMVFARDEEDGSKKLSREEIIGNVLLLILAGSETAASTLTVATLALGLNPDVLQKLKEEQFALMEKYGSTAELTREQLDKECPYLEAVVKETMRIKPIAGGGTMRAVKETMVIDGKQIPKGYGVSFNIGLTHAEDPKVKKDDGSHMDVTKGFKPERWLDDETKPAEFMPFGYGAHFCLGYSLAMAEMKIFLALFARRVDYDLVNVDPSNVEWKKASIIPKPKDGAVIAPRPAVGITVKDTKTA